MTEDYPVLYSFRRCPYAMRARMAVCVSGMDVALREVVLRDKPAEMLALSPKGTVPVLQLPDGRVIEESLEIMHYALAASDPQNWLVPGEGSRAEMSALISMFDTSFKHHLDRYKYAARYEDAVACDHRAEASKHLHALEALLEKRGPYLYGSRPALADYALMPFVRQFAGVDRAWFEAQSWHGVQVWLQTLVTSSPFTEVMKKYKQWQPDDAPVFLSCA